MQNAFNVSLDNGTVFNIKCIILAVILQEDQYVTIAIVTIRIY